MGLGLLLLSCVAESKREAPTAVNGVIDLSDWDFERDGPVELRGEWRVEHFEPEDASGWGPSAEESSGFGPLPDCVSPILVKMRRFVLE